MRVVKEHTERKIELLNKAEDIFFHKGYEATSVANIIDAVGIAKGTFYYYFRSKEELLDQIVERQSERIDEMIDPIVSDTQMKALDKFNSLFSSIGHYKAENRSVFIVLTRVLYSDGNILLLHKMTRSRIKIVAPKLAKIISQGFYEGSFNMCSANHTAEMILHMVTFLGDEFASILRNGELNSERKDSYMEQCRTYDIAVAKILGAPDGSITMFEREAIEKFFKEVP